MSNVELLVKLQSSRSNIISTLTRFKDAFDKLKAATPPDINQIEFRLMKVESVLDDFNKIQTEIEENDSVSALKGHEKERCDFEDMYFETISQANQFISKNRVDITNQADANSCVSASASAQSSAQSIHSNQNIKLPQIPLPSFDGNYEQWLFYKDTFTSLIHENVSIPAVQKFHYLRLSLKGEAADLLKALECSAANYNVAWDLLVDRYENKQMLIRNHIKAIFDIEPITREAHTNLRKLVDGMTKHMRALEALEQPVDSWDVLIIHVISSKLDRITRREWETKYNKLTSEKTDVTREVFSKFLLEKCKLLETLGLNDDGASNKNKFDAKGKLIKVHAAINEPRTPICSFCNKEHTVYNCKDFLALTISNRISEAKRLNFCLNCLRKNHTTDKCRSSTCRKCHGRHNSLLHLEFQNKTKKDNIEASNQPNVKNNGGDAQEVVASHICNEFNASGVLLSTALVNIADIHGNAHQCRVLLDNGSQSNLISSKLCERLKIPVSKVDYTISGIGQTKTNIDRKCSVVLQARHNAFQLELDCLVLPRVTCNIPSVSIDVDQLKIPPNLILADPTFHESQPVDMIVGANKFWGLLDIGQIKLGNKLPILQKNHLGWIISGEIHPIKYLNSPAEISCNFSQTILDSQLTRFWEIEETKFEKPLSPEEQACEDSFKNNTVRDASGRFVVTLPLKHSPNKLGDSLQIATQRLLMLEKRLQKNSHLYNEYCKFLDEYLALNHMTKTDVKSVDLKNACFLPHHYVLKESSSTTKLRVVFDASAKTTTNYSLNNILMVGPTVQEDLFSILVRSRKHNIILTGDIEKMYRQILVREDQRNLQMIVWRSNPSLDIQYFKLNTVTYGTAPASYLSTRCIKELANLNVGNEKINSILTRDFYVDDLVTGGQTIEEVKYIKDEITRILKSGGFSLRKFMSNNSILSETNSQSNTIHRFAETQQGKTLGLLWDSKKDIFLYSIKLCDNQPVTKRNILSIISQIFDPLGLLAPTVIIAKIIIQKLWLCKLNWDESIPVDLYTSWKKFRDELQSFNKVEISRHVLCDCPVSIELHSFSDASESAYGACIYLRSTDQAGKSYVHLVCAKTRVAPLKTITIPRLELCAALLSAELTAKVKQALSLDVNSCFHWCDSKIAIAWIKSPPHLWNVYISNRVSQIQGLTQVDSWYYVNTNENPADLLTRGVLPSVLVNNKLWWNGPSWLLNSQENWPSYTDSVENENLPEMRQKHISLTITAKTNFELINRYSSLDKLLRVTAYCIRFANNLKRLKCKEICTQGPLSVDEIDSSLNALIKYVQNQEFSEDIRNLKQSYQVKSNSKLLRLNPFLDDHGLLRVGGRIKHSHFQYDKKFPIILPAKHKLSILIVRKEHLRLLHVGPQSLLASIRDKFWILSARNLVKGIVRKCTRCFRFNAPVATYKMGDLPEPRVTPSRPFLNTGIDYCGPFNIKDRSTRNYKVIKSYICLFICLSTKAIHLELVSDLSTANFLAALRRFFSRRGRSANIYSDNGKTFVGADAEIQKFINKNSNEFQSELSTEGVRWHFIPPRAPNFGGLWEAGVKSTKHHLKRVLFNTILTYEEFCTVLAQIEACLNSRPLCPLSSDPQDPEPLTPGHFLIGTKLTSIPEGDHTMVKQTRLSKFQFIQSLVQHFWTRWSKEYISEMQQRVKWKKNCQQLLKPGVVVLIKEDNLPPLKWQLGVIQSISPGSDGIVRVATVRTACSTYKRPSSKLCVLPNFEDEYE